MIIVTTLRQDFPITEMILRLDFNIIIDTILRLDGNIIIATILTLNINIIVIMRKF